MEFDLREYQSKAAKDVLANLEHALKMHRDGGRRSSFSLSALTGAGKTVIATAVVEALINGSPDLETDQKRNVAFLWFTDDPALNRQTRDRMYQASDSLAPGQLQIIDDRFDQAEFMSGKVYFLNAQKLSTGTTYVEGDTDLREHSIWQTIANTAASPYTDLILVLDEAHKGMKPIRDKKTVVRQIIDGLPGQLKTAIPIVWGISATVERFEEAMTGISNRDHLASVQVDTELIRSSGLVKDKVILANPGENGVFNTTLLRQAVSYLKDMDARWNAYTAANSLPPVRPLMVVQVPDSSSDAKIGELVAVIDEEWPHLPDNAFVNVLHGHKDLKAAGRVVRYVLPDRVEDDTSIRFVIAKEAITTGWDCPRAEVLYSERPGKDETHIAQLIGRIVRTPLAKRVLSDEMLSTVACYLPFFDQKAVNKVVSNLETGDDAVPLVVVRESDNFEKVPALDEAGVYSAIEAMPSEPAPEPLQNPLKRAKSLAALLSTDGLMPDASAILRSRLNSRMAGLAVEFTEELKKNIIDVETVDLSRTEYSYNSGGKFVTSQYTTQADAKNINDAYKLMVRKLKEGVAEDYSRHLTDQVVANGDEIDYLEVKAHIAGLIMIDGVVQAVEQTADEWSRSLLEQHRITILGLDDERRAEYSNIQAMASTPERTPIILPIAVNAATKDGHGVDVDSWDGHVYQDENGKFATKLNDWEERVVRAETARADFIAWYRNPSSATKSALRIAYQDAGTWRSLQPDFIIVSRRTSGELALSVMDPHGDYLADALPKLQALATYAEKYQDELHRVEPAAKVGEELRVLDLRDAEVRGAVMAWTEPNVGPLFAGRFSRAYS